MALLPISISFFRNRRNARRLRFKIYSDIPPLTELLVVFQKHLNNSKSEEININDPFSDHNITGRALLNEILERYELYYQQGTFLFKKEIEVFEYVLISLKRTISFGIINAGELNTLIKAKEELYDRLQKNIFGTKIVKKVIEAHKKKQKN